MSKARPTEIDLDELSDDELTARLRRHTWRWLTETRAPVPEIELEIAAPDVAPASEAAKPRRTRAPRKEAAKDGAIDPAALFRRRAWTWLGVKAEPPKRKRAPKRELDPAAILRLRAWSWLTERAKADAIAEPKRRRAPRREIDPAAILRLRAWSWLRVKTEPAIAEPVEPKRKRAPKPAAPKAADVKAASAFRRRAWAWLQPREEPETIPAVEAPEPAQAASVAPSPSPGPRKKRLAKTSAPVQRTPVAELRRKAWAWLTGDGARQADVLPFPGAAPQVSDVVRAHLRGVLEALIFAADHPLPARELARLAKADGRLVKAILGELVDDYHGRGFRLDEVAGGYVFRTSPAFAPFVREQVAKKPVRMSRAQIETLAIVAYRQPITRPEIDDVRGVDSGAVLKSLLERDLVRILGKKDEPGRPMLYGTTGDFLEFFGLKALADLPTLREFTELSDESRRTFEREMGEDAPDDLTAADPGLMGGEGELRRGEAPARSIDPAEMEDDPTAEVAEASEEVPVEQAAVMDETAVEEARDAAEPEADASAEDDARAAGPSEDEKDGDEKSEDEDEDDDDEDEDEDEDDEDDDDDDDDEDEDDEDDDDEDDDDDDDEEEEGDA